MRQVFVALLTVILIASSPIASLSLKGNRKSSLIIKSFTKPIKGTNRLIVKYKSSSRLSSINGLYNSKRISKQKVLDVRVKPNQNIKRIINKLRKDPNVNYVEPNYKRKATVVPNDSYYSLQWGLKKMQASAGWDKENGASNPVIIAVIDTGVDLSHPDLAGKIVQGVDLVENDGVPQDDNGHGTHVAGIAAAATNNGMGVAGVSWNAKIMPIKVLSADGAGYDSVVAAGIHEAVDRGANIINMSLGGPGYSETLRQATDYAYSKGVLVVSASGNSGDSTMIYPAGNPNVLGVGATDEKDNRASFSTYNSSVDVSAPGVDIASTYWYNGSHAYAYMSGTSMATPNVAGLAALIKSKWPTYTAADIAARIENYSDDLGPAGKDVYFGRGRINIYKALNESSNTTVSVGISASAKRIKTGRRILIKGSIRPASSGTAALRYRKMYKRGRKTKRTKWHTLKRIHVDGSIYKTKVKLNSEARYEFAVVLGASKSRKMAVYAVGKPVRKKAVSINASAKRIRRGRVIKIFGSIRSKKKTRVVLKYKKGNAKWKIMKKVFARNKTYKMRIRLKKPAKYIFSVRVGRGVSRKMSILVR